MNGQFQNIWEVLGIQPTADKKAIRHAYARKCRECHPEDHPEDFRRLHQAYEQALASADPKKESCPLLGGAAAADPADTRIGTMETAEKKKHAFSESRNRLQQEEPEAGPASESSFSPERWEELLARGMEEDAAFPASLDLQSWQQTNRTRFSSAELTGEEELLEQMKLLEDLSGEHPPQDDSAWQQMMERWDLLASGSLFRKFGEKPCYFELLFDWLNAQRGRLHIPTIVGLLRIYQLRGRVLGHPWKSRLYTKKIPELPRLTYEFVFYQSLWNEEMFLDKFRKYGERRKRPRLP